MGRDNAKEYQNRKLSNSQFNAYLPNFLALPFKTKLKEEDKKISLWLKECVEKYLKKN